jgi:hypothetical protein
MCIDPTLFFSAISTNAGILQKFILPSFFIGVNPATIAPLYIASLVYLVLCLLFLAHK